MLVKVPAIAVVKAVYDLSRPQGMGYLHFTEGPLDDTTAITCIHNGEIVMDYVLGRACKFYAPITDEGVEIPDTVWFDHTTYELNTLQNRLREEETKS